MPSLRRLIFERDSDYTKRTVVYRVFQKSLCAELFAGSFRGTRLACDMHWTAKPTTVQVEL